MIADIAAPTICILAYGDAVCCAFRSEALKMLKLYHPQAVTVLLAIATDKTNFAFIIIA